MPTVSERLRSIDEAAMYEAPATTHRTAMEAADTIDALVAALEAARDRIVKSRDPRPLGSIMAQIDAALALASKRPGIPVLEIGE